MGNTHKPAGRRRSALMIMAQLIGLVYPMLPIMLLAVLLGTAGYLCAIFLTILAVQGIVTGVAGQAIAQGILIGVSGVGMTFRVMAVIAVLRGILHYIEQYCNHYIAFRLLAMIRHKVFAVLRKLCPAKLEGRDKGNLISIITTDIELLEVFYAHTISPIAIAVLTSVIMTCYIGSYHVLAGGFALVFYLLVGVVISLWNGKRGGDTGMKFRTEFGELNSFVLDSLRELDETIQYGQGNVRKSQMTEQSKKLGTMQEQLSRMEGGQRSVTNLAILAASFGMLALTMSLYDRGQMDFSDVLTCTVAMMGSFGPVVALSSLSNNLNQTLASGERVLSLLEEQPVVEEVPDNFDVARGTHETVIAADTENQQFEPCTFAGAEASHVTFAYEQEVILKDFSMNVQPGQIIGIHGASGSGKSTFLKLLMRFWDVQKGQVSVNGEDIRTIPSRQLRDLESYVTQETHLFHDSIAANIAIGKPGATRQEIVEAAKKASVHEFIMSLPGGYDTKVGELGDTLSGGEKQRIGIARAFLHDAPLILMDEPTSNLDSLNEGIILKSLREAAETKTVVLVSHRESTMCVADQVVEMENGRVS